MHVTSSLCAAKNLLGGRDGVAHQTGTDTDTDTWCVPLALAPQRHEHHHRSGREEKQLVALTWVRVDGQQQQVPALHRVAVSADVAVIAEAVRQTQAGGGRPSL